MMFAAIPGVRVDGRAFIGEAVCRGAAAILAPTGTLWPHNVARLPMIEAGEPRQVLARAAATLAGRRPPTRGGGTRTK
jgi:UDP-N-acetylmuramoyl-L-alanyl-D-glutamate--2,6-diaminopimelate ligase